MTGLVIGIWLTDPDQRTTPAVRSVEQWNLQARVSVDIAAGGEAATILSYAQSLQVKYAGRHILLVHENVYLPFSFLDDILSEIAKFSAKNVAWGAIGNSGIAFPYFKPISNMLVSNAPGERFAGVLPAAHLDPYLLLVHKDVSLATPVNLAAFPDDAPLNDVIGLAAWEAGLPCWICNLPVFMDGVFDAALCGGNGDRLADYLSSHYTNASFVSSFGTLTSEDVGRGAKDYYYGQIEPVVQRATAAFGAPDISAIVFATYHDLDIFDRCLMSAVSQFKRPSEIYIVGIGFLNDAMRAQYKQVLEGYRHYITIHWDEEEQGEPCFASRLGASLARLPDVGYSLLLYDTCVLFPHAVRQIDEFFQLCLGDNASLPISTAEISRMERAVDSRWSSQERVILREVEKWGFDHTDMWTSSRENALLHFTFPNAFLKCLNLADVDPRDLGSCLPQLLLSEPSSFFLIERGSGYVSFQKPDQAETTSPLREEGTAFHLANKAHALMATKSNAIRYFWDDGRIVPSIASWKGGGASNQERARLRIEELQASQAAVSAEVARLHDFVQQQETMLNSYRRTWYFKARKRFLNVTRPIRKRLRRQT